MCDTENTFLFHFLCRLDAAHGYGNKPIASRYSSLPASLTRQDQTNCTTKGTTFIPWTSLHFHGPIDISSALHRLYFPSNAAQVKTGTIGHLASLLLAYAAWSLGEWQVSYSASYSCLSSTVYNACIWLFPHSLHLVLLYLELLLLPFLFPFLLSTLEHQKIVDCLFMYFFPCLWCTYSFLGAYCQICTVQFVLLHTYDPSL